MVRSGGGGRSVSAAVVLLLVCSCYDLSSDVDWVPLTSGGSVSSSSAGGAFARSGGGRSQTDHPGTPSLEAGAPSESSAGGSSAGGALTSAQGGTLENVGGLGGAGVASGPVIPAGTGSSAASGGTSPGGPSDTSGAAGFAGEPAIPYPCESSVTGMTCIPSASFIFDEDDPAGPKTREATVNSFYIDLTEVTFGEYERCVDAGHCTPAAPPEPNFPQCVWGTDSSKDLPINCVNWLQAKNFCAWLGKRLPTDEEWDYAARRGASENPWGPSLPSAERLNLRGDEWTASKSWFGNDGFVYLAPVGSYPSGGTADGIMDLAGNVWEFTESRYCPQPESPCNSCALDEACEYRCDACPDNTGYWVLRGAGWSDLPDDFKNRLHWRGLAENEGYAEHVGFRCAKTDVVVVP